MQKGKSVMGRDVLSLATGARIHSVKDILIGADNDRVVALLVDEGGLLGTSTVVPFDAVTSFGRDAVVINEENSVIAASSDPEVKVILDGNHKLLGKTVFTEDGQKVGSIADLYFDEQSGRITGFEITGGVLGDLAKGSSYLGADEVRLAGRDVVFVSSSGAEAVENQVGGIQGAVAKAGDKVSSAAQQQGSEPPSPEAALVGRRSGTDVLDERGGIVLATGQRITADHVARAKATGNLDHLYAAAEAGDARERQERASETAQKVGDTAGDLWDKFTLKLGELTDATGQRVDEQQTKSRLTQINDAVGRPVTKPILDRNDDVILDLGDIITHQAVQRAHEAGLLDTLLSNVYQGQVTFERDEMKVGIEADSTVEKATGGASVVDELATKVETAEQERARQAEERAQQQQEAREAKAREREERAQGRDEAAREREEAEAARQEAVAVTSADAAVADAPAAARVQTVKTT